VVVPLAVPLAFGRAHTARREARQTSSSRVPEASSPMEIHFARAGGRRQRRETARVDERLCGALHKCTCTQTTIGDSILVGFLEVRVWITTIEHMRIPWMPIAVIKIAKSGLKERICRLFLGFFFSFPDAVGVRPVDDSAALPDAVAIGANVRPVRSSSFLRPEIARQGRFASLGRSIRKDFDAIATDDRSSFGRSGRWIAYLVLARFSCCWSQTEKMRREEKRCRPRIASPACKRRGVCGGRALLEGRRP